MKRVVNQFTVVLILFLGIYFFAKQIDWIKLFQINQISDITDAKLGDILWYSTKNDEHVINDNFTCDSVDSLLCEICIKNDIRRDKIKLHILKKDQVNAFALPGNHIVIHSGLIKEAQNQEELIGVICHELAHIQLSHIRKKLVKEFGLSILLSIVSGTGDSSMIGLIVKHLTSSSFDREYEKEADLKAVEYMRIANVNIKPFADFLYRLSEEIENIKFSEIINTHPNSKSRARYILEKSKNYNHNEVNIIKDITWNQLKSCI